MSDIQRKHLPKVDEAFDIHWKGKKVLSVQPYLTKALSQLKSLWAAVTKYHHQVLFQIITFHNLQYLDRMNL